MRSLPIMTAANCLQPDKQNDNDWDQGLLFLNPSKVWLQPPGYVTQMISRNYQPRVLDVRLAGQGDGIQLAATCSEDGKTLVLQAINLTGLSRAGEIHIDGFTPEKPAAAVEQLSGRLDLVNTAENPRAITPSRFEWRHEMKNGAAHYTFSAYSFTVIRLQ